MTLRCKPPVQSGEQRVSQQWLSSSSSIRAETVVLGYCLLEDAPGSGASACSPRLCKANAQVNNQPAHGAEQTERSLFGSMVPAHSEHFISFGARWSENKLIISGDEGMKTGRL